jgi:hypothetical protein
MDSRHLQPNDVVARLDLRFAVVVVGYVIMGFEMTVDDSVRMSCPGFVCMQRGQP